jgi:hypothetical protein
VGFSSIKNSLVPEPKKNNEEYNQETDSDS